MRCSLQSDSAQASLAPGGLLMKSSWSGSFSRWRHWGSLFLLCILLGCGGFGHVSAQLFQVWSVPECCEQGTAGETGSHSRPVLSGTQLWFILSVLLHCSCCCLPVTPKYNVPSNVWLNRIEMMTSMFQASLQNHSNIFPVQVFGSSNFSVGGWRKFHSEEKAEGMALFYFLSFKAWFKCL